jgi:hypothetical protein
VSEEKILTQHSQGKSGKRIHKSTYDLFEKAITRVLKGKELTHIQLFEALNGDLKGKFAGNINWYGETMKLDMEARKIIKRDDSKPQKYSLT